MHDPVACCIGGIDIQRMSTRACWEKSIIRYEEVCPAAAVPPILHCDQVEI
ncbi:MAG: hypothetical protein ACFFCZ_24600 [Promethearchaeota archaeon]